LPEANVITGLTNFLELVTKPVIGEGLLLRGQRCSSWEMIPGIGRRRPRQPETTLLEVEQRLVSGFKRQSLPHLDRALNDEWDVLAMAQHHGLATRLLDWTSNPLAALWFAVRQPPLDGREGVVYAYATKRTDFVNREDCPSPYEIDRTLFFQPSHLTARIVAQQGWFSVHTWNKKKQRFARFDHLSRYRQRLARLVIPPERFIVLRSELNQMAVNDATQFPDLDGLSRHLNWFNSAPGEEPEGPLTET
jgi:hypothetical protein